MWSLKLHPINGPYCITGAVRAHAASSSDGTVTRIFIQHKHALCAPLCALRGATAAQARSKIHHARGARRHRRPSEVQNVIVHSTSSSSSSSSPKSLAGSRIQSRICLRCSSLMSCIASSQGQLLQGPSSIKQTRPVNGISYCFMIKAVSQSINPSNQLGM